jgi:hypothetical protein
MSVKITGSHLNDRRPNALLLESIDQALTDLLGRRAKEAIYDHLERRCYMARDEIPGRLADFCGVLEANFGKGGFTIERTIAKRFYARLDRPFIEYPGYTLPDYVNLATRPSPPPLNLPVTTTTVTYGLDTNQP